MDGQNPFHCARSAFGHNRTLVSIVFGTARARHPKTWRATVCGTKFVPALGLSAVGVPLAAPIVGVTGSVDGVLLAMAACSVVAGAVALALPRGASGRALPPRRPAE